MPDHKTGLMTLVEFRAALAAASSPGTVIVMDHRNSGAGFERLAKLTGEDKVGDRIVGRLGQMANAKLGPNDFIGRIAGDLYAIFVKGPRSKAERIISELAVDGEQEHSSPEAETILADVEANVRLNVLRGLHRAGHIDAATEAALDAKPQHRHLADRLTSKRQGRVDLDKTSLPLRIRFRHGFADITDPEPLKVAHADYFSRKNPARFGQLDPSRFHNTTSSGEWD